MTEHNQRERAKSLAMLQAKGKHVLQNKFTPTPSHLTDIKVTMNCLADTMGFPRRCHK
ncbi:hypothetical protein UFOVP1464_46 [uncultured Caudovirales phage]|jgi:hypothetical protein|uniref:Uncharacterized protein n=1 Tax=uncultured Caudovirales phage TaxID=2100421 RepID=A0A6J5QGM2_9CAUD|nr:hypothetical protein UFOVP1103_20 [uncultured Caudovirales phage]CAB4214512.1 hypothetical protein UFOVP1464_46 [uncultured Caudovirales phage]CAB5229294.1 hypothetical protein UFOVP1553_16 [uncultured Caudovirales phage]